MLFEPLMTQPTQMVVNNRPPVIWPTMKPTFSPCPPRPPGPGAGGLRRGAEPGATGGTLDFKGHGCDTSDCGYVGLASRAGRCRAGPMEPSSGNAGQEVCPALLVYPQRLPGMITRTTRGQQD